MSAYLDYNLSNVFCKFKNAFPLSNVSFYDNLASPVILMKSDL